MKRQVRRVCGVLLLLLAFLVSAPSQAKIIPQVPDTQQPPSGSIGNPVTNACAPVSAVNITQYWDVVRNHPNAFHVNAALIPNTAADYLYYFMDTNNWGCPARMNGTPSFPASNGTYSIDIMPGFFEFVRWDATHPFTTPPPALPVNKIGYDWTYATDYAVGFNFHTAIIDTGRPDIICFKWWNPINSGTFQIDPITGDTIRFFTWGPQISGSNPPNPTENWNGNSGQECIGHAVTGVGYYRNYDPDGGGPLPNTNWFICHDNWSTTPVNVALPWAFPWAVWAATITADPGIIQIPTIAVTPDSIYHSQLINTVNTYNNDFTISNTGTGALIYAVTNLLPWITFTGISGNIPAGGSDLINVTVNTTAKPAGTYFDTLTITSNDPAHPVIYKPRIVIQVTLPPIEPCTFYKQSYTDYSPNGVPDFDQKQGNWWNQGSGNFSWCGPVALANCLWWFDSKFETSPVNPRPFYPGPGNPPPNDHYNLIHSYGPWDDHDINNVIPFINALGPMCAVDAPGPGTALPNLQIGFLNWLGQAGLSDYSSFIVMGPGYPQVRDSVMASDNVILLLGFYEILPSQDCQRLGGHYVTCAGACLQDPYICISDPFFDRNEGEPPPGTAHGSAIHNDAFFVSGPHGGNNHDRFHMAMIGTPTPCGPGVWGLTDYPNRWTQDGLFTFANENAIFPGQQQGAYQGGQIVVMVDAALIICPVPQVPNITVQPESLFYQQLSYRNVIYPNQIIICNTGIAPLSISSITSDLPWVTAGSYLVPLAAGECDTIDVIINTAGRIPATYTGRFHVNSNDPDTPTINKPWYSVTVIEPDISVTPDSIFHAQLINTININPNDFMIINHGSATLHYNAISALPWVTLMGVTGVIPPGITDPITVRVNTNGVAPGTYLDIITINSDDPDTPVLHKPKIVIQVTAPDIAVLPDSIYHSQQINTVNTYPSDFMVRNNGTSTLHYNANSPLPWITLIGVSGTIPPGGNDHIDVTVNTNGILTGTYVDIITINSDDPDTPVLNKPKIVIQVIPPQIEPCTFYKPGFADYCPNGAPDFDQKQGNWWNQGTGNFSWCGPVALANCLWWFDSKFEPSPILPTPFYPGPGNPPPNDHYPLIHSYGPWDDHDINNVVPFINSLGPMCNVDGPNPGTSLIDLEAGFHNWIIGSGLPNAYNTFTVLGPGYLQIRDSVMANQDVILLLGFYEALPNQQCQRLGGHYVTCAGACEQDPYVCISDPFFDKNEGEPPPGTVHGSAIHNDASLVSGPHGTNNHDRFQMIPIAGVLPCGPATWNLPTYPNRWTQDGIFTFANENPITPGQPPVVYQGGQISVGVDAALIICPIQEQHIPDINVIPDSLYHSQLINSSFVYNNDFTVYNNGNAILNYTMSNTLSWITLGATLGTIPPGGNNQINITVNTNGIAVGIYIDSVTIISNDPDTPILHKPKIVIQVTSEGCDYVVGDANNSHTFNGVDVVYSVSYFKGGQMPQYSCDCPPHGIWYVAGDVNNSCNFNGVDVTYMVSYFKGGPGPIPCHDCPPIATVLGIKPSGRESEETH